MLAQLRALVFLIQEMFAKRQIFLAAQPGQADRLLRERHWRQNQYIPAHISSPDGFLLDMANGKMEVRRGDIASLSPVEEGQYQFVRKPITSHIHNQGKGYSDIKY